MTSELKKNIADVRITKEIVTADGSFEMTQQYKYTCRMRTG